MTLKKLAETEKKHFKVGQKSTNQGDAHRFFFITLGWFNMNWFPESNG